MKASLDRMAGAMTKTHVAGESPSSVQTKNIGMSAQKRSGKGLSAAPVSPPVAEGRTAPSFSCPDTIGDGETPITMQAVVFSKSPYPSDAELTSNVVGLTLFDESGEMKVKNTDPFVIKIPNVGAAAGGGGSGCWRGVRSTKLAIATCTSSC
jgi:hypothetical protein